MGFCANSLGLQISSNGVISSTQLPITEKRQDFRGELVAPLVSSFSQYYQPPSLLEIELLKQRQNQLLQPQTLAQLLGLQNSQLIVQQQQAVNPAAPSPFLYLGQLTSSDPGDSQINNQQNSNNNNMLKRRNDERAEDQNQEKSSYELYDPSEDEYAEYVNMMPPPEKQEPNYYSIKPKKFKKYNEIDAKKKKQNVRRAAEDLKKDEVFSTNKKNQITNNDKFDSFTESSDDIEQSAPTSRLDFQMHGHKGPKSYKFGFDTGDGKNRQFRVEEKNEKGEVFGSYGYYDRKGKLKIVNYSATLKDGFKIL